MFAVMPPPIFSFGHDASLYRPAVSSPLTSSPVRTSSTSPTNPHHSQTMSSPLSSRELNTCASPQRDTQSSPLSSSQQGGLFQDKPNPIKFKFAGRETRPNPVAKKREDIQETRRRLFLQNVRQRADDSKWERRGGENELLKLEWSRLNRELRHAKDSDLEGFVREEEIEDELRLFNEAAMAAEQDQDIDSMMLDEIEQQEEAELDALFLALPEMSSSQTRPESPHLYSDDDDYDKIFMDFISSQSEESSQQIAHSQGDVEMS